MTNYLLAHSVPLFPSAPGQPERGGLQDFQGKLQAAAKWCWAAAAASVHATYGASPLDLKQCNIVDANIVGNKPACTTAAGGPTCPDITEPGTFSTCVNSEMDREGFLHLALKKLGLLEGYVVLGSGKTLEIPGLETASGQALVVSDSLDIDEIRTLVDNRRMVCLRIVRGDIRHFVIIYGYEVYPDNDLLIWNPAVGPEVVDFDGFWREFGPFPHKIITRPLS